MDAFDHNRTGWWVRAGIGLAVSACVLLVSLGFFPASAIAQACAVTGAPEAGCPVESPPVSPPPQTRNDCFGVYVGGVRYQSCPPLPIVVSLLPTVLDAIDDLIHNRS
ncbi:MAG: hypothetical protein QOG87_906 [Actinomycetota bacterium]|jgi:hypothetical protein